MPHSRMLTALGRERAGLAIVTDRDVLESYSRDASEVPASLPSAVVRARSTADVAATMRLASEHGVPVTPRASGTSRVGGAVPVRDGVVLSLEGMTDRLDIERDERIAFVSPGVVTGRVHDAVEAEGLFYAPDPSSLASCTVGGNIATNAGGARTYKYGVTREHVLGLEVVTGDGRVLEVGRRTRKGVTGYDVTALLVGSEGTLGVVTRATLRLTRKPDRVRTALALFRDEDRLPGAVFALSRATSPRCLELLDRYTLDLVRGKVPISIASEASSALLIELDGDEHTVETELERLGNVLGEVGAVDVLVAQNDAERARLWSARRELSVALRTLAKHKMSEDVVVPVPRLPELFATCRQLSDEHALRLPAYGHAGDGNLHVNFLWNDASEWPRVKLAMDAIMRKTVELGGTLSGEHGIGVLKAQYLPLEHAPELLALEARIKDAFDPKGVMNPGKIFPDSARRFHGDC